MTLSHTVGSTSRRVRSRVPLVLGLFAVFGTAPAIAVIPQFWEVRTYEEFREGEFDGVSLTADGRLVPAPDFEEIFDTGEPLVVSTAADSRGRLYLGTGHEGRVFVVDTDGNGRLLADLPELDVLAMAVDGDDMLYVATSPEGRVYRISGDGEPEPFFDPGTVYIWEMAFDREGRLLVATGDEGVLFRVDADGEGEVFYDSDETHIMSLELDGNGNVIAGGDPKGYLYRISEDGRAFVLHDASMREVHDVALGADGRVFAAVVGGGGNGSGSSQPGTQPGTTTTGTVSVTLGNLATGVVASQAVAGATNDEPTVPGNGNAFAGGGGNGVSGSMILEIQPNGSVSSIWESADEMVFSLLPLGDRLLFSTGTRGRVYEYESPGRATLVAESTEEQTTRLLESNGRILAASANSGKLFELADEPGDGGTYVSEVRDTSAVSSWGQLTWSGTGIEVWTRSGNTSVPDATWSDWTQVTSDGAVGSPRARFLQWRAHLDRTGRSDAALDGVTVPYLQQNYRPEVHSVDVLRPGVALRPAQGTGTVSDADSRRPGISGRVAPLVQSLPPRLEAEPGVQALRWTAEDDNDDTLAYSILYRAQGEGDWKVLVDRLDQTFYTIAANTLPDGMYVLRVVASDIGSNPPERALEAFFETTPFSMDHTPPLVDVQPGTTDGDRVRLRAQAEDATSILKQAEMSVDAGEWTPVFPVDGIIDSTREIFEFLTEPLDPGEHVISLRIHDQNDNVGIGAAVVRIP